VGKQINRCMELCLPRSCSLCCLILYSFQSVARMAKNRRLVYFLVFAVLFSKFVLHLIFVVDRYGYCASNCMVYNFPFWY
jgi:hypothetical protein